MGFVFVWSGAFNAVSWGPYRGVADCTKAFLLGVLGLCCECSRQVCCHFLSVFKRTLRLYAQ